jgi:Tol biopolymer transport system component
MTMGRGCILGAVLLAAACGVSDPGLELAAESGGGGIVTAQGCGTNCPPPTKIAFASDRDATTQGNPYEIYVMDADGTHVNRITHDNSMNRRPKLNKARTQVVWQRRYNLDFEIVSANIDGSNMKRLTNWVGDDEQPAFSPDGTRIVFTHCNSRCNLYLMDADGQNQTFLASDIEGAGNYLTPAFSPDGLSVVFGYEANSASDNPFRGIYRINTNGTGLVRLTEGPPGWASLFPVFNSDGTKISFSACMSVNGHFVWDLYTMNPDGTALTALLTGPESDQGSSYGPTTSNMMFQRYVNNSGGNEIFLRMFNGTLSNLTNTPNADDVEPSWQ